MYPHGPNGHAGPLNRMRLCCLVLPLVLRAWYSVALFSGASAADIESNNASAKTLQDSVMAVEWVQRVHVPQGPLRHQFRSEQRGLGRMRERRVRRKCELGVASAASDARFGDVHLGGLPRHRPHAAWNMRPRRKEICKYAGRERMRWKGVQQMEGAARGAPGQVRGRIRLHGRGELRSRCSA